MTQAARQAVVRKFTKSTSSVILLASLKAGGVGLNLVSKYFTFSWIAVLTSCFPALDRC